MAKINSNYDKLAAGYLFPEIARRTSAFLETNEGAQVMRLGIGDTTEPIVPAALGGLRQGVDKLGNVGTYSGYGASEGVEPLREAIAAQYQNGGCATLFQRLGTIPICGKLTISTVKPCFGMRDRASQTI